VRRPRILFVEDESSVHFALREFFGALGYLVDCVRNATSALENIARVSFDVVVVDLRLSGEGRLHDPPEGLALVERVRREHPTTRLLVLSACASDLGEEALRRGADRFLQKPQPLSVVAEALEALRGVVGASRQGPTRIAAIHRKEK
jgi:two-component system phosphate regulon response regulator OmpR